MFSGEEINSFYFPIRAPSQCLPLTTIYDCMPLPPPFQSKPIISNSRSETTNKSILRSAVYAPGHQKNTLDYGRHLQSVATPSRDPHDNNNEPTNPTPRGPPSFDLIIPFSYTFNIEKRGVHMTCNLTYCDGEEGRGEEKRDKTVSE